jgi:hypothetical protein
MANLMGAPSLPIGVHIATCVGFRGPVPTKATDYYKKGRMQAVTDFKADIAPAAVVSAWSNWPWDIEGWPPVLNGVLRTPTEAEIAQFSRPLRATAATPQGDITLYGILQALGGIKRLDSVNFRTDTEAILGKRCKIEIAARQAGGTYIRNVFVDQEALTTPPPPEAATPASVNGAVISADLVVFAQSVFAALKSAGVSETELRGKLSARGAQKIAFLKTDNLIIELLLDWVELAVAADKAGALPDLPSATWTGPLVSIWNAAKTPAGEI